MPRVGGPSSSKSSGSSFSTPTTKRTYDMPFFGPPALKNPIRMQNTYEYDEEDEDGEEDDEDKDKNRKGKGKKPKNAMSSAAQSRLKNIAEIIQYWDKGYLEDFMKGLAYRGDQSMSTKKLAKAIVGHLERRAKRGCRLIEEKQFANQLDREFGGGDWESD
ncbi:hypothetical protein FRC04_004274 [Tulasnella sp. 424]|nr:hypothetical protein FRC04_004274 [Tulasnella sp. 424]KAG8979398.1 hypothetical protein FRC05_008383 [Tulasnella sp. 425]